MNASHAIYGLRDLEISSSRAVRKRKFLTDAGPILDERHRIAESPAKRIIERRAESDCDQMSCGLSVRIAE